MSPDEQSSPSDTPPYGHSFHNLDNVKPHGLDFLKDISNNPLHDDSDEE